MVQKKYLSKFFKFNKFAKDSNLSIFLIVFNIAISVSYCFFSSIPIYADLLHPWRTLVTIITGSIFIIEYWFRVIASSFNTQTDQFDDEQSKVAYIFSFLGIIDLVCIFPLVMLILGIDGLIIYQLLTALALVKVCRYVPDIGMVKAVIALEQRPLIAALCALGMLMILMTFSLYLVEVRAQPAIFKSINHTIWWGTVTMFTIGYGDIVPITMGGKIFGSIALLTSVAMRIILTAILANGFRRELNRREILENWRMVSQFPLFEHLDGSQIAIIASMLKTQIMPAHSRVVTKGEDSDSMYFIVQGEVEVSLSPKSVILKSGDFFGETGLLESKPRSASIFTRKTTRFLVLGLEEFKSLMAKQPEIRTKIEIISNKRKQIN